MYPSALTVLILAYSWSFLMMIGRLRPGRMSVDGALFHRARLGPLFIGLTGTIAGLDAAAVFYLFRPAPLGYIICLVSLWLSFVESSIALAIARHHAGTVQRAWRASRRARGFPDLGAATALVRSPRVQFGAFLATWLVCLALSVLVYINRPYFHD